MENLWDNGEGQLTFSLGDKAFLVIHRERAKLTQRLRCKLLGLCLEVEADGGAQLEVAAELSPRASRRGPP